eukprot:1349431-Amphidinium_carterae.1
MLYLQVRFATVANENARNKRRPVASPRCDCRFASHISRMIRHATSGVQLNTATESTRARPTRPSLDHPNSWRAASTSPSTPMYRLRIDAMWCVV